MAIDGKQLKTASIDKTKVNFTTPVSANEPAIKSYVDAQVASSLYNQDWKSSCRVASVANVSIVSAPSSIDSINLNNGDRILLKNQSTALENGLYTFTSAGAALVRTVDADNNSEVTAQMAVMIEEGTVNGSTTYKLVTPNPIIVGTTGLTYSVFSTVTVANPSVSNKFMTASVTTTDGDAACATPISSTPNGGSFVKVTINGDEPEIGNGLKTKDCYFSGDGGTTARAFNAIVSGDTLRWNGSIAGYQLAVTDKVSFEYNV